MPDIAFILLYVENVAASEAFYARTLGRPAVESSPRFAMIPAAPGVMLGLWRRDEIAPEAGAPGGGEIAFALENDAAVDAAHAQWRDRGVRIAQAPTRMDFGYTFLGLDPDGHRVRVFAPGAH
jgi:catechol 2,3-dioxygenase-like lactoylglutathione lyase family enzyme